MSWWAWVTASVVILFATASPIALAWLALFLITTEL
jgi:hypothetical protein